MDERKQLESSIHLWSSRLGVEDEFKVDHDANVVTKAVMESIRDVNARVLALKRQNLARLIEDARRKVRSLQEALLCSEAEKAAFAPVMEATVMDETCLEAHDAEIARLGVELDGKKQILELLEARTELLTKLREIRARETDKNRYKNRQAQILQDDLEKKKSCKVSYETHCQLGDRGIWTRRWKIFLREHRQHRL
jgi:predicted RNase H-like nuclease (RuvC/YqgF family)